MDDMERLEQLVAAQNQLGDELVATDKLLRFALDVSCGNLRVIQQQLNNIRKIAEDLERQVGQEPM